MAEAAAKSQPKRIVVDGQTVENRSMEELRTAENDTAVATARAAKKLPFKMYKISMPGSVY